MRVAPLKLFPKWNQRGSMPLIVEGAQVLQAHDFRAN